VSNSKNIASRSEGLGSVINNLDNWFGGCLGGLLGLSSGRGLGLFLITSGGIITLCGCGISTLFRLKEGKTTEPRNNKGATHHLGAGYGYEEEEEKKRSAVVDTECLNFLIFIG